MGKIIDVNQNKHYQAKYRNSPKGRRSKRNCAYKTLYGITLDQYEILFKKQRGRCALCKKDRSLHVDHNHVTNNVRGLLCRPCNVALGTLGDDEAGILKALAYVRGLPWPT